MASQNTLRAADFTNGIGVNVHVEYTDGKYASASNVIADLKYLGVNHVRDQALNASNQGQASYGQLADAGVKFTMFFWDGIPKTLSLLDAFVAAHPGSITAIEGPNEVNNFPISYNGLSGNAGALAYQQALYGAVKADPALAALPVYNVTSWPELAGRADYANIHPYVANGDQPYAGLAQAVAGEAAIVPGAPVSITETGYYTLPNGPGWGGVDMATQAKLTLNLLLDAAALGVKQTYLYELLDAYADPGMNDPEKHFGLFDINNNPKPVATAIHNLTTLLADTGANAASFTPGTLNYTLSGLPAAAKSLVIAKSSGAFDLVVWNEPDIWNETTHTPITAASLTVSLNLGTVAQVTVYDPLLGLSALQQTTGSSLQFSLVDHPVIIEIVPGATAAPAPSAPAPAPAAPAAATAAPMNLDGGSRDDVLNGAGGADNIRGMDGNDSIDGGAGDDLVNGNAGADTVRGGLGNDNVMGGKDNDIVFGDDGADTVNGNIGADTVYGGQGSDLVYGGQNNDILYGEAGADTLSGDLGNDTLTGGAGADRFIIGSGQDVITDFNSAEGDRIQLSGHYSFQQQGANLVISAGNGLQVTLMGVSSASLGDWLAA